MKTILTLCVAMLMAGCMPSLQYQKGQGFYSDFYTKSQVQAAADVGSIKNLGRFSIEAGGCGNYSRGAVDRNIVIPAIKEKLHELGANVADNVVAKEQMSDATMGMLIVPGLMACTDWTIRGDALLMEKQAMQNFPASRVVADGGQPVVIVYKRK